MPVGLFLLPSRRATALFLLAGVFAALFAWSSYNLFQTAMANLNLLRSHGWAAAMDGGAWQLLTLVLNGYLSLTLYLGFRVCEDELIRRWRSRRTGKETA